MLERSPYRWLLWLLPYRTSTLHVALAPAATLAIFDRLSVRGLSIASRSPLNQGRYRVWVGSRAIAILGPEGLSRFPLRSTLRVEAIAAHSTRLHLRSQPTLPALLPLGTAAICWLAIPASQLIARGWGDRLALTLAAAVAAATYALGTLFFHIEAAILVQVLQRELAIADP